MTKTTFTHGEHIRVERKLTLFDSSITSGGGDSKLRTVDQLVVKLDFISIINIYIQVISLHRLV